MTEIVALRTVSMLYLVAVLLSALAGGWSSTLGAAVLSFLAYNFFFIEPRWTLAIGGGDEFLVLAIFIAVALIAGTLAARAREQADEIGRKTRATEALLELSNSLSRATGLDEVLATAVSRIAPTVNADAFVLLPDDEGTLVQRAASRRGHVLDIRSMEEAQRVYAGKPEVEVQPRPAGSYRFRPLRSGHRMLGVVGIGSQPELAKALNDDRTLDAMIEQAAIAIDRAHWVRESARAAVQRESDRLQSALLSSLSHDLRTPLASITGAITSLRELGDKMPPETRDDLMLSIEEEAARLTRFVTNLFDMMRIESGTLKARRELIDLPPLIAAAVRRAKSIHPNLLVETSLASGLMPALADATLLEQVLFNLLDNARKYSAVDLPVTVYARAEKEQVVIAVTDQGKGIPAGDLKRIFDRFYRRAKGDGRPAGTGLGLSIARGFIEAMGGTITAQSPAIRRRGSRFVIRLPALPSSERLP